MKLRREELAMQRRTMELQFIESEHKYVKFQQENAMNELKRDLTYGLPALTVTLILIFLFSFLYNNYLDPVYGFKVSYLAYLAVASRGIFLRWCRK